MYLRGKRLDPGHDDNVRLKCCGVFLFVEYPTSVSLEQCLAVQIITSWNVLCESYKTIRRDGLS